MADKSRNFVVLLYPDNDLHRSIFHIIRENYKHIGIMHDRDELETAFNPDPDQRFVGEKKHHWHLMIQFDHARHLKPVSKELGLDDDNARFIGFCKSEKGFLLYLTHFSDGDKFQYSENDVFGDGDLRIKMHKYIMNDGLAEEYKVNEMIDFIEKSPDVISVTEFTKYACNCGRFDVYRRSALIFKDIIRDHNERVLKKFRRDVLNDSEGFGFYD